MAAFGAEPRVLREVLGQEPQPRGIQVDAADGDVGRTDVLHPRFASERADPTRGGRRFFADLSRGREKVYRCRSKCFLCFVRPKRRSDEAII